MIRNSPIGIVCGSGIDLKPLIDTHTETISFEDCPEIPKTSVSGHQGKFLCGTCMGVPIVLQCGRLHIYEGHTRDIVIAPVNTLHSLGVRSIVFTNAAGGLKPDMKPGDLLAAQTLALGPNNRGENHPDRIDTDFVLRGCNHMGTYTWIHGPSYETQAEIRALQSTDTDAVGMSTAPEITRCRELGIRAASISCITNNCCSPSILTHDHVLKIAAEASQRIAEIIREEIPRLAK